jgi:hypothetical protein
MANGNALHRSSPAFGLLIGGDPGERERDSRVIPNGVPGCARAVFRDEAEQFQAAPGREVPFFTRRTLDDGEPGSLFSPIHLKKVGEG